MIVFVDPKRTVVLVALVVVVIVGTVMMMRWTVVQTIRLGWFRRHSDPSDR